MVEESIHLLSFESRKDYLTDLLIKALGKVKYAQYTSLGNSLLFLGQGCATVHVGSFLLSLSHMF